jgi:hypothetical protein
LSMAEEKMIRLGQASRKLNVGHNTILEFLAKKGFTVENNPNAKLTAEMFALLAREFASSASEKIEASILTIGQKHTENLTIQSDADSHRKKRRTKSDSPKKLLARLSWRASKSSARLSWTKRSRRLSRQPQRSSRPNQ